MGAVLVSRGECVQSYDFEVFPARGPTQAYRPTQPLNPPLLGFSLDSDRTQNDQRQRNLAFQASASRNRYKAVLIARFSIAMVAC